MQNSDFCITILKHSELLKTYMHHNFLDEVFKTIKYTKIAPFVKLELEE